MLLQSVALTMDGGWETRTFLLALGGDERLFGLLSDAEHDILTETMMISGAARAGRMRLRSSHRALLVPAKVGAGGRTRLVIDGRMGSDRVHR